MTKKVADLLVDVLAEAGVRRIYGVVGDSLNGITDSIRVKKNLEWVHVRHEEAGAFAAGAEAHLTGTLAVCAGSCGPGNMHLINGLYDCQRNRVPVPAIAAHIPSREIGSGYFQETDPKHLFAQCSHYCELVSDPEQMPRILETANESLAFVEPGQKAAGFLEFATDLQSPDFAKIAEGAGLLGLTVRTPDQVEPMLAQALKHDGPAVVEVFVARQELAIASDDHSGTSEGLQHVHNESGSQRTRR